MPSNEAAPTLVLVKALVAERDRFDPNSGAWAALDQRAFDALIQAIGSVDPRHLIGLELWAANGPCRLGRVTGVIERGDEIVLVLDHGGRTEPLVESLSCGWLQEPGATLDEESMVTTLRAVVGRLAAGP